MRAHDRGQDPAILAGVRVADFSRVLAGPYATMMLADFGADVIKIEGPDGDETRAWRPPADPQGSSTYFAAVNRNKRSMTCDLAGPDGAAARRLAATADVVVENFRPGVMERFGLGYEQLAAVNPRLVYCSITGFGRGAGAELPGYDLIVQALGGLMSVTGEPEGRPMKVGVALVDVLTGLNAFSAVLLALRRREQRPGPQRIDVDLLSSLLAGLTNLAAATLTTGEPPGRFGNAHPSIAPYETFETEDRMLAIAVGNDRQFAALCRTLDLPDLPLDHRFDDNPSRVQHRSELREVLEARLRTAPASEWQERLTAARVPAGAVSTVDEAFALAERLGLGLVTGAPGAGRQAANPIRMSSGSPTYRIPPPPLGDRGPLGWSDERDPDEEALA
ncbi:CoA transferase [Amnibacterium sp. CER49]|uniref:CaiB/BaiF CoA transferase family protein n=1 Tax=Amnibacterium sp. CER49 TaxID=3039161 RepID=UPI00244A8F1F|nr:CoA transferase [Amnibacterium sp. CER49]MDH2442427.1 CoA transferase [Amnibacterium sp. CER49]